MHAKRALFSTYLYIGKHRPQIRFVILDLNMNYRKPMLLDAVYLRLRAQLCERHKLTLRKNRGVFPHVLREMCTHIGRKGCVCVS